MPHSDYVLQILELIEANGWTAELTLEIIPGERHPATTPEIVRVKLSSNHPISPNGLINEYQEGQHPLEQIQQECLRALRTGHPGL
jgi:hypothetical protein